MPNLFGNFGNSLLNTDEYLLLMGHRDFNGIGPGPNGQIRLCTNRSIYWMFWPGRHANFL